MPGIFEDERREIGAIWSNPAGTWSIITPDVVANCLKWPALRRNWRLADEKNGPRRHNNPESQQALGRDLPFQCFAPVAQRFGDMNACN